MKRLQFELPDERVVELDEILERTGLKTRVNLFNHALTLFEWAVRERESGRIIASMDEETGRYKELEMPGLPRIIDETSETDISSLISDLERRLHAREYHDLPSAKELAETKARMAVALIDMVKMQPASTDDLKQWLDQVEAYKTRIQDLKYHSKDLPKSAEEELRHLAEQTETFSEWGKWFLEFQEARSSQGSNPRTEHRATLKISEAKQGSRVYGDPDEPARRE
jgi:hypothetical protein